MNRLAARSPANRLPLFPQEQTFRGLSWTSVVDPTRTSDSLAGAGHWGLHAGSCRAHFREGLETLTRNFHRAFGAGSGVK